MTHLGNVSLLDQPKHGFLCSRCTSSSAILPCLDWAVEHAHGTEPIMSTFHSEIEVAVLDLLLSGSCPIILALGRCPFKVVPDKFRTALENGRLLIVSLFDACRISRDSAQVCNNYICQSAQSLTFGFLSPGSLLLSLYESCKSRGVPVNALAFF